MLCQNCEMNRATILTYFEGLQYLVCNECYLVLKDIILEGGFDESDDDM